MLFHLTSREQEWFVTSSVLKVFKKFGFKVPPHVITQLRFIESYVPLALFVCSPFCFFFISLVGFSCGLELYSEADFAETLLDGSFGFV